MTEFARQHPKSADTALLNNDTAAALDLLTLAELQIALIGMESTGAMTEAQISEFINGVQCLIPPRIQITVS